MTVFRDDLVVLLPELRAVARSLTRGNGPLADDVVQDALVSALNASTVSRQAPSESLAVHQATIRPPAQAGMSPRRDDGISSAASIAPEPESARPA